MNTQNLEPAPAFAAPPYRRTQGTKPQAESGPDSLQNAFLTAMLLTGSISMAEGAVLAALHSASGQPLLHGTVLASLKTPGPMRLLSRNELQAARNRVPPELRAVMLLPRLPRQCFVLSILLSQPRRECALLLNISEAEVGRYSAAAASVLALGT